VDDPRVLKELVAALAEVGSGLPVLFPVHPRTRANIETLPQNSDLITEQGSSTQNCSKPGIHLIEPLPYLEFLDLMRNASLVLTDSGGIQEETTVLGRPCLTLRENTERPSTVEGGGNILVGMDPERIVREAKKALKNPPQEIKPPPLWDGRAAERIVDILAEKLS